MSGVANVKVRRFGFAKDVGSFKAGDGTFVNPSCYHDVVINPGSDAIERDEDANSFGDVYPPDAGVQSFDASVIIDASEKLDGDVGALIQSALGAKLGASALTWQAGGGNTAGAFLYSGGTPAYFAQVLGSDSVKRLLPVKTPGAGTATLAVQQPGGVTSAGAKNPSDVSGSCYYYLMGTTADTYMLEFDRAGQSKQIKYRAQGAAVSAFGMKFERRKRLQFMFGFTAAGWLVNPSSFQLADPAVRTTPFVSFCADIFIQSISVPAAGVNVPLKQMDFGMAPELIPELGTLGLDGSGNISQSDIQGFTRGLTWLKNRLKTTLTYPAAGYHTDWRAGTVYQVVMVFYPGRPGAAAAVNRIGIWFPCCVLAAEPKLVTVDNQEAQELTWNIGRDPSLALPAAVFATTNG